MADVLPANTRTSLTAPKAIPHPIDTKQPLPGSAPASTTLPKIASGVRSGHLNLDTFSPVNQNGSFAFDRVLRSGEVHKRTRKTKQWKSFYLVLRPNLLSLYKSPTEERLLKQIRLNDLNTVGYLKDPKGRRQHLFGLFSPERSYHFQGRSDADAKAWVELIKREAPQLDEDEPVDLGSPTAHDSHPDRHSGYERWGSSSPEPLEVPGRRSTTRDGIRIPGIRRLSAHELDYSGDELAHYSDFSDTPPQSCAQSSSGPFAKRNERGVPKSSNAPYSTPMQPPATARNVSESSGFHADQQDDERVIWHGYLLCLKTKGGVRQWKRLWVVLRPKNLAFYKNDEEYAANLIIPLSGIINAVEIDPISRSKAHCMQVIAEEKSYRFCASSEDALAEWLGALKSQLTKRKDKKAGTS
ncbi:hypothetical protein HO133_001350 [Letharia lupina]|uniref:PH domain-containing protein n=1 Tax=Letharia lupina TaxID=560253 RepID=A0A8H6CFJ5_9LECA|nr:uncharacterized protein HO133_001350 [Letharia lupina]KAF6222264.1 hypothetical protein HO133_001350 [Letharia lupina]